jgi:hypothetical protein
LEDTVGRDYGIDERRDEESNNGNTMEMEAIKVNETRIFNIFKTRI